MEKINLKNFFLLQKKLDEAILEKHHLTLKKTFKQRLLALLVELSELANETKCFKFWSQKKIINKEKLFFEYIDVFHFFLSLGNYFQHQPFIYYFSKTKNETQCFLKTFKEITKLIDNFSIEQYQRAFQSFLKLSFFYGLNEKKIKNYYLKKRIENFKRQKNDY